MLAASCARPSPERSANEAQATGAAARTDVLILVSNTQATLEEVRIGAGNFREGEYQTADGGARKGASAGLWISVRDEPAANRHIRVGKGSTFAAGRYSFEVLEVGSDTVRLRRSPRHGTVP